jgi:hypothetical protein
MKSLNLILLLIIITNSAYGQTKQNQYFKIMTKFEEWKSKQYQLGIYELEKNCNMDFVSKETYKGSGTGISTDIQVYYTDLNNDNIIDALICFNPFLCDGGNALMNSQARIIIVSKGNEYIIDDKLIDNIENKLTSGWLYIRNALYGDFMGEYLDYKEDDGRCCPSIKKEIRINYKDKKLEYTEQ